MDADSHVDAIPGNYSEQYVEARARADGVEEYVIALFEKHRASVFRHVAMILTSAAESEDVTQEAFLRLHLALMEKKRIEDMKAWIFKVAHNLALDRIRTAKAVNSLSEEAVLAKAEASTGHKIPNPEQELLSKERFEHLHNAILQLSSRQRECLSLKAEGFRYQEIAEILGIGRASVIENVRRAMSRLVKELQF